LKPSVSVTTIALYVSGSPVFGSEIEFSILNPSTPQTAPGMTVEVNYYTTDNVAVQWANAAIAKTDYSSSGLSVVGMIGSDNTTGIKNYPMHIREAIITSSIRQTSPWMCDTNSIVVTVSADIDLHPLCVPLIRLQGLTGSATGDSATLALDYNGTTRTSTGTWVQGSGSLEVAHPSQTQTIPTGINVVIRFDLTNKAVAQLSPHISLAIVLDDVLHDPTTHSVASMGLPADASSLDDTAWNARTACGKSSGDAQPLQIRAVAFNSSSSIGSDSANPCALTTVTVTLRTTGPVFTDCVPKFTLSGMSNTATSDAVLSLTGSNAFEAAGVWTQNNGTLVVTLKGLIFKGCVDHVFNFSLTNIPLERHSASSVPLSTGSPAVILADVASILGMSSALLHRMLHSLFTLTLNFCIHSPQCGLADPVRGD